MGGGRGSWMDIFIRKMTSYLPCPPSISPPPALFPPQPHSQHVRWFDSYDSATPLLTAHPFICAAVAVYGLRCHGKNRTRSRSPRLLPPHHPPLLSSRQKQSWKAASRWALVSLFPSQASHSPDRRLTRSQRLRAACKTVRQETSAKYWRTHPTPLDPRPPLLIALFWQVKTNVTFFPAAPFAESNL